MKIDNQTLFLFANSMATCLSAGLTPRKSLELSGARMRSKALQELIRMAVERCDQGMALSETLEPSARFLPHYFIPIVRAGETSGRLVEAFQLLERHSYRIGPSVRLVRNTWLYPLICIVFGWMIRTGIFLYFGKHATAWHFVCATFGSGGMLVLLGWLLLKLQLVKRFMDLVLLQLPIIREAEIRQAVVLFFSTFRLVYEAGGVEVVAMFDLASQTVRNSAMREDFQAARRVMEQNGTFGDAFEQPTLLENDIKGMIHTGSISGRLDRSFNQIVETATQQLELTLQIFNQFFQRLVSFSVAMSIVETVLICIQ